MQNRREFMAMIAAASAVLAGPVQAGGHGRVGRFSGKSGHTTTGRAELVMHDGKAQVVLLDDFDFDGAPDPKVGLGNNGFKKSTLLGKLQKNKGKQSYDVPARIDPSQINEVWIWCEKFNVPLGVAKLN